MKKQTLGFFPTPLTKLTHLTKALAGPEIFIKRDDNTGLALGGNKTRKLEYILADALSKGADTIITAGAEQSNHCRQTAAAAASLQLECHLVLGGEAPENVNGNLLLDYIYGCNIHWAGKNRKGEDIPELFNALKKQGKKPYIVPYGGSNEFGALGFVDALKELETQQVASDKPFTHIIFASSSGGTQAGLMLGKAILGKTFQLIGINIDKGETSDVAFDEFIITLANNTAKLIGADYKFSGDDLLLNSDYVGEGYGVIGDAEKEAISMMARTEGILLDPVYTGRAMAGLIDMVRKNNFKSTDKVLFWHTGGAPALFAYAKHL